MRTLNSMPTAWVGHYVARFLRLQVNQREQANLTYLIGILIIQGCAFAYHLSPGHACMSACHCAYSYCARPSVFGTVQIRKYDGSQRHREEHSGRQQEVRRRPVQQGRGPAEGDTRFRRCRAAPRCGKVCHEDMIAVHVPWSESHPIGRLS